MSKFMLADSTHFWKKKKSFCFFILLATRYTGNRICLSLWPDEITYWCLDLVHSNLLKCRVSFLDRKKK